LSLIDFEIVLKRSADTLKVSVRINHAIIALL